MKGYYKILAMALFVYVLAPITAFVFIQQVLSIPTLQIAAPTLTTASGKGSFGLDYLAYTIIGLIAISIIFNLFKHKKETIKAIFKLYVPFTLAVSTIIITSIWASVFVSSTAMIALITLLALGIVLYFYFKQKNKYFNYFGIIIAIGYSVIVGIFLSPIVAIGLLIIFAVYDYIAVFITKHMQVIASTVMEDDPLPLMITSENPTAVSNKLKKARCGLCGEFLIKEVNVVEGETKENYKCPRCGREVIIDSKARTQILVKEGDKTVEKIPFNNMSLGLGDLMIPTVLPVSIISIDPTSLAWVAAIIGATLGIALNIAVLNRKRMILPAIPLICICELIAVGIVFLL